MSMEFKIMADESSKRMKWTPEHDKYLLREILLFEPWNFKYGSRDRGSCWERISESLNQNMELNFKTSQRGVSERYQLLEKAFKRKRNEENKASGISPIETEADMAIADIIECFEEAKKESEKSDIKKKEDKCELAKAEDMRRMSLETFNETLKRRSNGNVDEKPTPKRRNTGNEAINFLKERSEEEKINTQKKMEIQEKELKLRKEEIDNQKEATKAQMELFRAQLNIQQQESRNNSQLIMQMMQQQQQFFLGILNSLNKEE